MSKPFTTFKATTSRAHSLLKMSNAVDDPIVKKDLVRAAVVFAVAGYDHYFTSKFVDVLSGYLRNNPPNKDLVILLERAGLNTRSALEIAVMKRPFRRIRSLLQTSLGEKTTHRQKAIDGLFASIDLPGLSGRVHKTCDRKNLGARIDKLVELRNSIVHSAHVDTRGKERNISAEEIRKRVQETGLFVENADKIIDEWVFGTTGKKPKSATD